MAAGSGRVGAQPLATAKPRTAPTARREEAQQLATAPPPTGPRRVGRHQPLRTDRRRQRIDHPRRPRRQPALRPPRPLSSRVGCAVGSLHRRRNWPSTRARARCTRGMWRRRSSTRGSTCAECDMRSSVGVRDQCPRPAIDARSGDAARTAHHLRHARGVTHCQRRRTRRDLRLDAWGATPTRLRRAAAHAPPTPGRAPAWL